MNQSPQNLTRKNISHSSNINRQATMQNDTSKRSNKNMVSPIAYKNNTQSNYLPISQNTDQAQVCGKHNKCQFEYKQKSNKIQLNDTDFSIDSELLRQQIPTTIDIQPQIQLQVRPQIDLLISTNVRVNMYKDVYKKIQKQQEQRVRAQQLEKVNQLAKQALQKTKTLKQSHKNKWGHSIYGNQSRNQIIPREKKIEKNLGQIKSPHQKNQTIENASEKAKQRIKQYKEKQKQKQLQKQSGSQNYKKMDKSELQRVKNKIQQNAEKILQEKQKQIEEQKKRKQLIKRKILELQKQSLNNCKKSRQNPVKFQQGKQEDLKLGDSQYSTFEARKEGRKITKKDKKKKRADNSTKDSKVIAQTSSRRQLKQRLNKSTSNFEKKKLTTKGPNSEKEISTQKQNMNEEQTSKKQFQKFYVWQVPIKQQDYSLIALNKRLQFQKTDKMINKSQKSFKQEAEEFLKQKLKQKYQSERQKTREQFLEERILEKKNQILKEFNLKYGDSSDLL